MLEGTKIVTIPSITGCCWSPLFLQCQVLWERAYSNCPRGSPGFSCRNRLSNPFSSGLLDLAPPTLLSQFGVSQLKTHLVSFFSMKAFLIDLEAKRAQGRTKNDLSKRRFPLRRSGALWCYQLTVIRTEAWRYQVSAQPNTGHGCCPPPPYGRPAGSGVLLCQEHTSVCYTVKTHLDLLAAGAPLVLPWEAPSENFL